MIVRWPGAARPPIGSALVIAILVTAVLTLLGVSFLVLGGTDNRIAQHEKFAAQALYVAESGARAVQRWFDAPTDGMLVPPTSAVDRRMRRIRDELDPYGPTLGSSPAYKEGVDRDGDGADDLFDRPYRGSARDALLGTPDGPDMRIDAADPEGAAFLAALSRALFGGAGEEPGGVVARIARIDVFSPPYEKQGTTWARFGLGTVRVVGRVERTDPGGSQQLAERVVEVRLAEIPYHSPLGPLHSCGTTTWTGPLRVRWGSLLSAGRVTLSRLEAAPQSLPRGLPSTPQRDPLWNTSDAGVFAAFRAAIDGREIPDPWFRVVGADTIAGVGASPGARQPFPPPAEPTGPDHSNLLQLQPSIVCPRFDYEVWKAIATSGARGVHYFAWGPGGFREDGTGPALTLGALTNGGEGIYFFDTIDGDRPTDDDGDGEADNLTPATELAGGWRFRGVLYANTASIRLSADDDPETATTLRPPGEPFQDLDQDGEYDLDEGYVNLDCPALPSDVEGPCVADADAAVTPGRDARGPGIAGVPVALRGILYTSGRFEATGRGTIYGSVIARQGVTQSPADGSAPTPAVFWDADLPGMWPPEGWALPRTTITGWSAEP